MSIATRIYGVLAIYFTLEGKSPSAMHTYSRSSPNPLVNTLHALAFVTLAFVNACTHVPPVATDVVDDHYVNDQAAVLTIEQRADLAKTLADHNRKGPGIITLLILPTLPQGTSIEDYAVAKINEGETSTNEKSDRILLVVAMENRELMIETAEGVPARLSDQYCKQVIDNVMVPQFRQSQYFSGIRAGIGALIEKLESGSSVVAIPFDPLKSFTTCTFDDGLTVVDVKRISGDRSVPTKNGPKRMPRVDSYRIMFAYPNTDYFVNLHADMSMPGQFQADKETILDAMGDDSTLNSRPVEHTNLHEFDVYAINDVASGGVISWYSLFYDRMDVTVTAYFLNQRADRRKFQSHEEYHVLRDRFLERYVSCVRANQR